MTIFFSTFLERHAKIAKYQVALGDVFQGKSARVPNDYP